MQRIPFFRVIAGDWFSDTEMALDKDAMMQLQGAWVYEWAELENVMSRQSVSRVKAFLTSTEDKYRPPFGRTPVTVKRSGVIVGTTNNQDFLHDPSGSRRFWVVPVGTIDTKLLRSQLDQLLAEAVAAHTAGERRWLDEEEERRREALATRFVETDPWDDRVLETCTDLVPCRCNPYSRRVANPSRGLASRPNRPARFVRQPSWRGTMRLVLRYAQHSIGETTMADVRVVVIDVDQLQRLIVEAVRAASSERSASDEWVDARTSGLGRRLFLRLAREGALPVSKRGRAYVARRTDVDAYLERQRIAPSPLPPDPPTPPSGAPFDPIAAALAQGRLRILKKPP